MPISRIKTDGIQDDAVTSAKIGVNVIVADDLAANSVTVSEITNGAVTSAKLDTNIAVTGTLSAGGALTSTGEFKANGGVVFNEDSLDVDFRVESNNNANMLVVDAGNDRVGIGTASPSQSLHVKGNIDVEGETSGVSKIRFKAEETHGEVEGINIGSNFGGLAFKTNSNGSVAERMRIDSSGNVGIGTSSQDSNHKLEVTAGGTSEVGIRSGNSNEAILNFGRTNDRLRGRIAYNNSSEYLAFWTNQGEKMRIDSSGNVGIGATPETTFAQKKVLRLSSTASLIAGGAYYPFPYYVANNLYYDASDNLKYIASSGGALLDINAHLGGRFSFYTAPAGTAGASASITERIRIDTTGNLLINNTAGIDSSQIAIQLKTTTNAISVKAPNTQSYMALQCYNSSGGRVGYIQFSTTATTFSTSSDYRLKENVTADWDATTRLKQLNPVRFNFIADADTTVDGFLAHEVSDIVPEAITGTKDGMRDEEYEVTAAVLDDDGNEVTPAVMGTRSVPDYQGIDQGKLVPLLVKTIQELEARITALESN